MSSREDTKTQGRKKKVRLSSGDRERIREAHDLLIGNLSAYLPIDALAKKVGLNREKLCRGFREFYGKSIFACFANHPEQGDDYL